MTIEHNSHADSECQTCPDDPECDGGPFCGCSCHDGCFRPEPTHHCMSCGKPLWDSTWPYAACRECGQKPCAHGIKPGECPTCDAEGDRAYDASKRA